jgi:hypothetical protein
VITSPAVYLDECVDYNLLGALTECGFLASAARDEQMIGATDESQLAFATRRGELLLTHNGRDFHAIHRAWLRDGRDHAGIIVLPETPPFARLVARAAMALRWIAMQPAVHSQLFTWGQFQQRLEAGDRPPGSTEDDVRLALGRE